MKKQRVFSIVVAELLGLCVSLWSVSAVAECRTYSLYGDLWFSDRRVGTLSQAQWLTLGPAPNVEVQLVLSPGTLSFVDIESSQPSSWWCPSGVDCNSEDFDDYEGATNIYTDLNGHWSADVILCLRKPASEYGIQVRPIFKMQNARWKVVNESYDGYQVVAHSKALAASDPTGGLDFGITGVPWFNSTEYAMWLFQTMRDVWNFVEVDGGCSPERGFTAPCGFYIGGSAISVRYITDAVVLRGECGCVSCSGCSLDPLPEFDTSSYSPTVVYHEYGHTAYNRALRGLGAPPIESHPVSQVHEAWAYFFEIAVVSDGTPTTEVNICAFDDDSADWKRTVWDLYDLHSDCALPGLGIDACDGIAHDGIAHGIGQLLFVFRHMSDQELKQLRAIGNEMNAAWEAELIATPGLHRSVRTYTEAYASAWAEEAVTIWPTISWYRLGLFEIFLMNCLLIV